MYSNEEPVEHGNVVLLNFLPGLCNEDEPIQIGVGEEAGLEEHAIGNIPLEGHCAFMVGFAGFGDCPHVAPPYPASGPVSCSQVYRVVFEEDGKIFLRTRGTGASRMVRLAQRFNFADLVNTWVWNRLLDKMMTAIRDDVSGEMCLSGAGDVEN